MSDPLDLEALKKRSWDRRFHFARRGPWVWNDAWRTTQDDADRAIEIAEQARQDVLRLRDELDKALRVLYLAYAAGKEMARCGITLDPDWPKIQDEAYEAVGEYLYPGPPQPEPFVMLADTKHYEQHRQEGGK